MATLYITIVLPWKLYEYAADVRWSFKWREIFYARTKGKTLSDFFPDVSLIIDKRALGLTGR